jgi:hypothetical protein
LLLFFRKEGLSDSLGLESYCRPSTNVASSRRQDAAQSDSRDVYAKAEREDTTPDQDIHAKRLIEGMSEALACTRARFRGVSPMSRTLEQRSGFCGALTAVHLRVISLRR